MIKKFVVVFLFLLITTLSSDWLDASENQTQKLFDNGSTSEEFIENKPSFINNSSPSDFDKNTAISEYDDLGMINRSVIEDFESGDFNSYDWTFGGEAAWTIDTVLPEEGTYSAKSGLITHGQSSELLINVNLVAGGLFSFYCKVSSENVTTFHDGLRFYIDNVLRDIWHGEEEWSINAYPVSIGNHTFKWIYEKDSAGSNGDDCAWIDFITFPDIGSSQPVFGLAPSSIHYGEVIINSSSSDQFIISNTGNVALSGNISTPIGYSVTVADQILRSNKKSKANNNSDNSISYTISAGLDQTFDLVFSPSTATTYNNDVIITSNDTNNPTNNLSVTGSGYATADIFVSTTFFEKTLDQGDSTSEILILGNTGGITLDYIASVSYVIPASTSSYVLEESETSVDYIPSIAKVAPIQYDPADYPAPIRQGGEDVGSAFVIPELPFNDSGTTAGYANDYDEACTWTSTSPDVVYSFTPTANIINGIVSLCGETDYDSKLYIYENTVTQGSPLVCNDDECISSMGQSYVSELSGLSFTTGNIYYIIVDGYGGGSGNYELDITGDFSYNWLTLDGFNQVNSTIDQGYPNEEITVMFNTVTDGLTEGVYEASIAITSNDPDESPFIIPVSLTVLGQLDPPANLQILYTGTAIELTWDMVTGANSYKVYSSDVPFTGFIEDATGIFDSESWSALAPSEKKFYQVKALN